MFRGTFSSFRVIVVPFLDSLAPYAAFCQVNHSFVQIALCHARVLPARGRTDDIPESDEIARGIPLRSRREKIFGEFTDSPQYRSES